MFVKVNASGTMPKRIMFYYNRDTLFNDVSLMSNYMAKNLATKEGNSLTDEYAISDDERDLFDVSVRACLPDIYESMMKVTNSVDAAFEDEFTASSSNPIPTTPPVTSGKFVVFYIRDNEAFNPNVLTLVDSSLNNVIKQGTLKEFYETILQAEFFKVCSERFLAELFKLKQRLFQLKKKSVSSNLT